MLLYRKEKRLQKNYITVLEPIFHKEYISRLNLAVFVQQHIVFDTIFKLNKPQNIAIIKTLLSISFVDAALKEGKTPPEQLQFCP